MTNDQEQLLFDEDPGLIPGSSDETEENTVKSTGKAEEWPFSDGFYIVGIFITAFSALVYFGTMISGNKGGMVCYLFTAIYWVIMIIGALFSRSFRKSLYLYPALVLALISCYGLNQEITIFAPSPTWFGIALTIVATAYLAIPFYDYMPKYLKFFFSMVIGVGLIIFTYLAIYLLPWIGMGIAFCWFLGLPAHLLVPLVFVIITLRWIIKQQAYKQFLLPGFLSGAGTAIIIIIVFCFQWATIINTINRVYNDNHHSEFTPLLPSWIRVAQHLPKNKITEMVLKVNLKYFIPEINLHSFWRWDTGNSQNFTETEEHNPFIVMAVWLCGRSKLENQDKINILKSIYDSRNQATERLWRGNEIETTSLASSILIWPQYRMSYTEQIIQLRNNNSWQNGEAIYTFHLPEGSAVSSLSLWVDGVERKGIMTSDEKADSAYKQIVGVENRDPSVIHWQEGSIVTVRVFPVTSKESRTFKIGVTSPLYDSGDYLKYKAIYFDGTDFSNANEKLELKFMQTPRYLHQPSFIKKKENNTYSYEGNYKNNWEIIINKIPIVTDKFSFDGKCYSIGPMNTEMIPVDITDIFLDINRSWTNKELEAVNSICKNKNVWIFNNYSLKKYSPGKKDESIKNLQKLEFSLFPVHMIKDRKHSLLISKSATISPNFSDIKETDLMTGLKSSINPGEHIYFFNLGEELSPYLQTLLEYRILQYQQGTLQDLEKIFSTRTFLSYTETDNNIAVQQANISINRTEETCYNSGNAPDHLMRLFAYNHILQQFTETWEPDSVTIANLEMEARQAYVVSPVSSLIVLETQRDYDRFNITDIETSLHNASTQKDEGRTPIGDLNIWEWITITGSIVVVFLLRKRSKHYD